MRRRLLFFLWIFTFVSCGDKDVELVSFPPQDLDVDLMLPLEDDSVRFAVIGDTGTGDREQYEVAAMMERYHSAFPFEFVLMTGDNLYGSEDPSDYLEKFERPYQPLLEKGVRFYASLGNHDNKEQRMYKNFHMGGERYHTFKVKNVRFFVLDSDYMDPEQLKWLEQELKDSGSDWKIAYFHHPIYSSGGRHGPDEELREVLEPVFTRHGVDVVFSGHEHFYERLKPQKGIHYFICGAGGKLRRGNIRSSRLSAEGFDEDHSFLLVEIAKNTMHFQVISRLGRTVDSGQINNAGSEKEKKTQGLVPPQFLTSRLFSRKTVP